MKKILISTLFGAFAVAQETTTPGGEPSTSHSIFYSVDLDYKLNGTEWKGEHLVQYVYKFSGGYAIKPTLSFWTYHKEDSQKDWVNTAEHYFLQFRWTTPKFWDILGYKTNVEVRYTPPTSETDQLAGSYGTVQGRLVMEKEFNSHFNLTIKPKLALYAQRNGNAVHTPSKPDKERNTLAKVALEIAPQWKFNENLTLTYGVEVAGGYKGNGSGKTNVLVVGEFYQEIELMYNIASLNNLGAGLIFINDDVVFGNNAGAEPFKADHLWAGVRLQKNFDL